MAYKSNMILFLLGGLIWGSVAQHSIYVSPAGSDDTGDGTMASPYFTFLKAVVIVRSLLPSDTNVSVYFRAGAYYLTEPLLLGPEDSGSGPNSLVRYVAGWPSDPPSGGAVVVHAGARVGGWVVSDASRGIWSAPLPQGVSDSRQVYKDGERLQSGSVAGGLGRHAGLSATGYSVAAADTPWLLPNITQQFPGDVEFVYTGVGSSWTESRLRVASVEELTGGEILNISMAQPGWTFHPRAFGQRLTYPASISNLYAGLGNGTGFYYLNSATRTLYYSATPGENPNTHQFMVPSSDLLFSANATRWISLEGLTWSYAGWLEPNSGVGYVDIQSGFRYTSVAEYERNPANDTQWVPVPGNIQLHGARNVSITGCTFSHLGATALEINDGSQYVTVQNCTFNDVSAGGLLVGQVNDLNVTDPTAENGWYSIVGNAFLNIPVEFHDCAALLAGFVLHTDISHNAIVNNSNIGISVGWGWSRDLASNAGWNTVTGNYGAFLDFPPNPVILCRPIFCCAV